MKFDPCKCPECGEPATHILEEYVAKTGLLKPDEQGEIEFAGGTDIDYESGTLFEDDEGYVLFCCNHHHWHAEMDGNQTDADQEGGDPASPA